MNRNTIISVKPTRLLLLPGLALLLGVLWQLWHPEGLIGKKNRPQDGFQRVRWEEARAGQFLLIDARSQEEFEARHIPGALSLPSNSFAEALEFFVEEHGKTKPVLVYCNSTGDDSSLELAQRLKVFGVNDVKILEGGFHAWRRTQP